MNLASPWVVQISMLPLRREYPDDKRNEQTRDRTAVGRQRAIEETKLLAARNRKKVLSLFIRKTQLQVSVVADRTGLSRETARVILNEMADAGLLAKSREGNTYWFMAVGK